ncbi:hypothetical protein H0A36_26195 [Endozoicomonas sp. SM1973]|uniref:Uncharacterized protein n=1 Tax=Spartinivicinus marinus TaxID=2994442 RepID=A0A853I870_9GAMM|nr:hypothetical protein [Spartinivicinus marinus]NYZ69513.1 hypothetical protein [Spartinivicinus marinus]
MGFITAVLAIAVVIGISKKTELYGLLYLIIPIVFYPKHYQLSTPRHFIGWGIIIITILLVILFPIPEIEIFAMIPVFIGCVVADLDWKRRFGKWY